MSAEPGDGVTGKRGLNVTFSNQRYAGPPVYQYLLLAPGRYLLEGRARTEPRGVARIAMGSLLPGRIRTRDAAARAERTLRRVGALAGISPGLRGAARIVLLSSCAWSSPTRSKGPMARPMWRSG